MVKITHKKIYLLKGIKIRNSDTQNYPKGKHVRLHFLWYKKDDVIYVHLQEMGYVEKLNNQTSYKYKTVKTKIYLQQITKKFISERGRIV